MTDLIIDSLTMRFSGLVALDEVSFSVKENEIFSLIGPNGSGKTTVIRSITDRCVVMKDGKIIEQGSTKKILEHPQNAYTQTLINAAPKLTNFQLEL